MTTPEKEQFKEFRADMKTMLTVQGAQGEAISNILGILQGGAAGGGLCGDVDTLKKTAITRKELSLCMTGLGIVIAAFVGLLAGGVI